MEEIEGDGAGTLSSDFGAKKGFCIEKVCVDEAGKEHAGEEGELEANARTCDFDRRRWEFVEREELFWAGGPIFNGGLKA